MRASAGHHLSLFLIRLWTFVVVLDVVAVNGAQQDTFDEELLVRPLTGAFVASDFTFTTTTESIRNGNRRSAHFRLFPKALGEILAEYGVDELHLSFTRGSWRYGVWGLPPPPSKPWRPSESPAPSGVELWAWFGRRNETDVSSDDDVAWTGLCNALSGLFCASLNFVDVTNTVTPTISFRRRGVHDDVLGSDRSKHDVRYATLPQEAVCTENLTPWKKLLPCGATAGLATLLNARQLFNVHYLSMGIHVRPVCRDRSSGCSESSVELSQTLSMVSEMSTEYGGKQDWSFKRLYDVMLFSVCPVATSSFVYVDLSKNVTDNVFELSPAPSKVIFFLPGYRIAAYNLTQMTDLVAPINVAASYSRSVPFGPVQSRVLLTANRYIRGYGQEMGVIECIIRHEHPTKPLRIVYMEQIPSFAVVYSHTFRVKSNGRTLEPDYLYVAERADKSRPFHLEAVMTLPPNSVTEISLDFDKTFLKWTAYPPDANHGFYLGPAVISTNMHSESNSTYFMTLRTQVLLLSVPTPDFSMPYNVICLVCTVLALAFGPLHNITTKRLSAIDTSADVGILSKIKSRLVWRRTKVTSSQPQT